MFIALGIGLLFELNSVAVKLMPFRDPEATGQEKRKHQSIAKVGDPRQKLINHDIVYGLVGMFFVPSSRKVFERVSQFQIAAHSDEFEVTGQACQAARDGHIRETTSSKSGLGFCSRCSLATLREAQGLTETIEKANRRLCGGRGPGSHHSGIRRPSPGGPGPRPEAIVSRRESGATGHPFLDQPSATIMSQYLIESPSMGQKTTQIHIYVGSRTPVDANSLGLATAMRVRAFCCGFG
jgi:hypothetical protein